MKSHSVRQLADYLNLRKISTFIAAMAIGYIWIDAMKTFIKPSIKSFFVTAYKKAYFIESLLKNIPAAQLVESN